MFIKLSFISIFLFHCVSQAATLSGKVAFSGTAPAKKNITMGSDPKCPKSAALEFANSNSTLKEAFVWISKGAAKTAPAATPVKLDQKGCMYEPHVVGIQVGQTLDIYNSDPVMHNVHSLSKKGGQFNNAMVGNATKPLPKTFKNPETMVRVKCDVHPWMSSYIGVVDHPYYAVTSSDGTFTIKDVPAGTYTVEAWHESFPKTVTQEVTVANASEAKSVNFTLSK